MLLPRMWRPGRETKAWGPSEVIRIAVGREDVSCQKTVGVMLASAGVWGVGSILLGTSQVCIFFITFILCSFVITAIRKPYTYSSNFLSLYLRSLPWHGFPYLLGCGIARKPQIGNE